MASVQTTSPAVPPVNLTGNQYSSYLSELQSAYGIFSGIEAGGVKGDTTAAISGANLAAKTGAFGSASSTIGTLGSEAGSALGIYSGLQQGGAVGDLEAAASAAKLASTIGAQTGLLSSGTSSALGTAAGVVGVGLDLYNEVKTWQSGATGSDALSGAETGAAVGSIVPGIGTAIGAVVGAAVGALSSLFGGGKTDPETTSLQNVTGAYTQAYNEDPAGAKQALSQMTPAQSFQMLAGAFDAKNNSPGHSEPLEQALGRMGEGTFLTDMAGQINSAFSNGTVKMNADGGVTINSNGTSNTYPPGASATGAVMSQVVTPWMQSITGGQGITGPENGLGGVLQGSVQNLVTAYMNGSLTAATPIGQQGQAAANLPAFVGTAQQAALARQTSQHSLTQGITSAVTSFPGSSSSTSTGSMLPVTLALGATALGTGANTGASSMADPMSGAPSSVLQSGVAQSPAAAPAATAASGSSDTSSIIGSLGTDLTSFLNSPTGELAEFGTIAGLGLSQANAQKGENDQLAASLGTQGQPYTAGGQAILGQIQGGAPVSGPLGASISQQTSAASNLGNVANEYSTGQLTSAQQQQVQQYIQQQRAQVDTQLAASGNADSSAKDAAYQQIDNNAAQLSQSLVSGNTQIATQALTAVQQTYSTLLNQSLSEANFGFGAQEAAVQTQITSDTALSQSLNQLFAGLAQGFGTALGGNKGTSGTGTGVAQQAGAAAAGAAKGAASGVASTAAGGYTGTTGTNYTGSNNAGSAPDITNTDFSSGQLFGNTTPGFDTAAVTGTTPSFDTGFMDNSADPFGDLTIGNLPDDTIGDIFADDPL